MKMRKMTFDTNLYSRQMYAMGRSAMEKLREAKNLILAGIGHVSIHDAKVVSWNDLSAQFYVTENDIGKNRAEASFSRLQELNDSVQCTCLKPNPLSEDDIKNFDLVIVTMLASTLSLKSMFCITDENGEACKEVILEHINCETDGDHVVFSEVVGASELNNLDPVPIRVLNSYTFNIISRHWVNRLRIQISWCGTLPSSILRLKCISSGKLCTVLKRSTIDHRMAFCRRCGAFGKHHEAMNTDGLDILKSRSNLFFPARGNLQPMASIVGGVVAQEAMKAVTGHTTPLKQFVYIDCSDALPGHIPRMEDNLKPSDCEARNSRYDGQAAVFVGAGAIGCELLKNMGMMGSGCDPEKKGRLIVTDMDTIEISNLSRQFLFRRKDVGSKKSEVAASVVKQFNSQMNILSLGERVSGDTEHVFSDRFFKDLTGVANALDNVEARMFVDGLCVYYQLPLLESGTMGTKGNTQSYILTLLNLIARPRSS
uniref:THIF-type NAD/FAD binding fold domain-containing protein n=1 Tax=Ditylenchus dipsaci TaxID=166011 RepID=A0A915CRB2_9BILA